MMPATVARHPGLDQRLSERLHVRPDAKHRLAPLAQQAVPAPAIAGQLAVGGGVSHASLPEHFETSPKKVGRGGLLGSKMGR
jgi:hypothetical protein